MRQPSPGRVVYTLLLMGLLAILAPACGSGPSQDDVIESLVNEVIVPRYEVAVTEMAALAGSLDGLCATPSVETLDAAREQWRIARAEWLRSSASWIGPVMDRRSRSLVSWPVTDTDRIETMLDRGGEIGAFEVRETLAASQVGLGAMEYLIFGADDDVLDALVASPTRCDYLRALGVVASQEVEAVRDEWSIGVGGGDPYAAVVTGDANVSLSSDAAIEELVRTSIFLLRAILDSQLGPALGVNGGDPDMTAIPGSGASQDVSDLRAQVLGIQDIYLGGDDTTEAEASGLSALVRDLSAESDDHVREALRASLEAVDALTAPLRDQLTDAPAVVQAAYDRLKDLQRVMETEVVSLLGVTVGFGDLDGDSG